MVDRLISVLVIFLQLYEHVNGDYCQHGNKPSISFCQNGTISGAIVSINGSSIQTKIDLGDRECVCYLEQSGNMNIFVNAEQSCVYCGLRVSVGNSFLRSSYQGGQYYGWGNIVLNDTKFTMALDEDGTSDSINTAFCITIQTFMPDNPVNLILTCEELVMMNNTSSTAISTSPNLVTTSPNMEPHTTQSHLPTSAVTAKTLTKTATTRTAEISIWDTNVMQDPIATNTSAAATITTAASSPREHRSPAQNDVLIPAAAGAGAGVLIILVIVIVACCLRKKRQNAETPIHMKEVDQFDVIMTENPTYATSVDIHTNSVPHIGDKCTGDVYAVVSKEGNSRVLPSNEVPHMQVGETGDIYAIVNKENAQEISNTGNIQMEKGAESLVQTRGNQENITFGTAPSTDYADIAIDDSGAKRPVIKIAVTVDYAHISSRSDN